MRSSSCSMKRRNGKVPQAVISLIGVAVLSYFVYHIVHGERGLYALLRMEGEVKASEMQLSRLQKERAELEHRTDLMRPESLDPDLLDEKARELLDYSKPNEVVVLLPKKDEKKPQ